MNIFGRGVRYLSRKKLRSILLLVILTALAASILICLTIRNRADAAAQEISKEFGASFTIEIDVAKLEYTEITLPDGTKGQKTIGRSIQPEEAEELLEIDGITGCRTSEYSASAYVDIDLIPGFYHYLIIDEFEDTDDDRRDYIISSHLASVYCVGNSERHEFFDMGAFELVEGRHITINDNDENHLTALISDTVAEKNGLEIGDTFTGECRATIFIGDLDEVLGEPFEFEIVGIYKVNFHDEISNYTIEYEIAENAIFSGSVADRVIGSKYAEAMGSTYDPGKNGVTKLTLYVESPDILDSMMEKVSESDVVEWQYYKMYKDDTEYEVMVRPLRSMITLTTILMFVFGASGFVILALLMAMWTKSRRQEMGIYLSIGLRKRNIVAQIIGEILVITLIAIILSVFIALPVSDSIGNRLADKVVDDTVSESYQVQREPTGGDISIERASSDPVELNYFITASEIVAEGISMIAIAIISAILSAHSVLRMKPKDILSSIN